MHIKAHPAPYRVQPTNANCGTPNFPVSLSNRQARE